MTTRSGPQRRYTIYRIVYLHNIYSYIIKLYHLVEFSLSIIIIHSTFHIIITLITFFHFESLFPCFMLLITVSMIHASYNHFNHLFCFITSCVLCFTCIFQEVDNGYDLYVPEGTITVRDSDLYLYDPNGATIMIQTRSISLTQMGPLYL